MEELVCVLQIAGNKLIFFRRIEYQTYLGRYNPVFPAVSPYTTAVGATMGPQDNSPEVACQSQLGFFFPFHRESLTK